MRPRKHKLALSLDNLRALMIPGKPYSAAMLSHIFNGSAETIGRLLEGMVSEGKVDSGLPNRGCKLDLREERRIYWVPVYSRADAAGRRIGPAEVVGELRYDLMRHQRLCTLARR
jgi:hypothetical protein